MKRAVVVVCPHCERQYDGSESCCPAHGDSPTPEERPSLELSFDFDVLREQFDSIREERPLNEAHSLWRYAPFFPVDGTNPVTLGEGGTDLIRASTLGDQLDIGLWLKLEGENPTGSAKDRGSTVVATHARERGQEVVACASTGNAAASIAAYAARAGLECVLFVPETTPEAKAIQPRVYGASVTRVDGGYDAAVRACRTRVTADGWLDRSAGASPYAPAGAQTLGYELAEQRPDADWVVVPMGNGGTLAGVWNGLRTFERLGYLDTLPKMLGVQATAASAIHDSFHGKTAPTETRETTCADSIDVRQPHRRQEACEALTASNGTSVLVTDEEIRSALVQLGHAEGVFAEPASASTLAAVATARERGYIDTGDQVVAVITGTGLKDTASAMESIP